MPKADMGGIGRGGPWITVNVGNDLRPASDVVADITAKASQLTVHFEPGSLDAIRSVHTVEHIASDQIVPTLAYWRRFLKPGGQLIIVVPDMGALANDYADGLIPFDIFAAAAYVPGSRVGDRPEEQHRWGFDDKTLWRTLCEAGYKNVRLGGDEHWVASWVMDMHEVAHTGLVGVYKVANLIMVGEA